MNRCLNYGGGYRTALDNLKKAAAKAIIKAFESKKDGRLFMSYSEVEDMQADVRTPETYDKNASKVTKGSSATVIREV